MGRLPVSQRRVLSVLVDGGFLRSRQIGGLTGIPKSALWEALKRCWVKGTVLRSELPIYEPERLNKGRAGRSWNVRPFHLYALRPHGVDELLSGSIKLVRFSGVVLVPEKTGIFLYGT